MIRIITAELKSYYCLGSIYDQLNQNLWGKGEASEYFCKALQETLVCKLDEEPLCSNLIEVKIHTVQAKRRLTSLKEGDGNDLTSIILI